MLRGDVSKGEPESVGSITKFHKIPQNSRAFHQKMYKENTLTTEEEKTEVERPAVEDRVLLIVITNHYTRFFSGSLQYHRFCEELSSCHEPFFIV